MGQVSLNLPRSNLGDVIMLREDVITSGKLPEGFNIIRDCMPLTIIDLKRTTSKNKLLESNGQSKEIPVMRCTGVFQKADEKNANGRIYPLNILKEAVEKIQPAIKARRVIGEFDHPSDAKIHLDRASHLVTKLNLEGKTVIGELEIINDDRCPCGNMLACYLDRGIQIGISSRGIGDMDLVEDGGEEVYQVREGYEFITFDSVAEPSVSDTQLQRINEAHDRQIASTKQRRSAMLNEAREHLLMQKLGELFRT